MPYVYSRKSLVHTQQLLLVIIFWLYVGVLGLIVRRRLTLPSYGVIHVQDLRENLEEKLRPGDYQVNSAPDSVILVLIEIDVKRVVLILVLVN